MRERKLIALVAAGVLALAGCGGGSHKENGNQEGGNEAEQAQQRALERIPQADRTAFLGLATSIGVVRASAAPVAVGTSSQLSPSGRLLAARSRVAALQPVDPRLIRVRAGLLPLLTSFAHAPASGPAARVAARHAIAVSNRLEAGLRAYTRSEPAIGGVIPD